MMGCLSLALSLDCLINCGGSEFDCLIGGGRGDKIGHDPRTQHNMTCN